MLSLIALPQLLAAGYNKELAVGTVASAGTLGILIPPAIMLVVMAEMLNTRPARCSRPPSMPGLLLSGLYLALHPRRRDREARATRPRSRTTTARRPRAEFWRVDVARACSR